MMCRKWSIDDVSLESKTGPPSWWYVAKSPIGRSPDHAAAPVGSPRWPNRAWPCFSSSDLAGRDSHVREIAGFHCTQ